MNSQVVRHRKEWLALENENRADVRSASQTVLSLARNLYHVLGQINFDARACLELLRFLATPNKSKQKTNIWFCLDTDLFVEKSHRIVNEISNNRIDILGEGVGPNTLSYLTASNNYAITNGVAAEIGYLQSESGVSGRASRKQPSEVFDYVWAKGNPKRDRTDFFDVESCEEPNRSFLEATPLLSKRITIRRDGRSKFRRSYDEGISISRSSTEQSKKFDALTYLDMLSAYRFSKITPVLVTTNDSLIDSNNELAAFLNSELKRLHAVEAQAIRPVSPVCVISPRQMSMFTRIHDGTVESREQLKHGKVIAEMLVRNTHDLERDVEEFLNRAISTRKSDAANEENALFCNLERLQHKMLHYVDEWGKDVDYFQKLRFRDELTLGNMPPSFSSNIEESGKGKPVIDHSKVRNSLIDTVVRFPLIPAGFDFRLAPDVGDLSKIEGSGRWTYGSLQDLSLGESPARACCFYFGSFLFAIDAWKAPCSETEVDQEAEIFAEIVFEPRSSQRAVWKAMLDFVDESFADKSKLEYAPQCLVFGETEVFKFEVESFGDGWKNELSWEAIDQALKELKLEDDARTCMGLVRLKFGGFDLYVLRDESSLEYRAGVSFPVLGLKPLEIQKLSKLLNGFGSYQINALIYQEKVNIILDRIRAISQRDRDAAKSKCEDDQRAVN